MELGKRHLLSEWCLESIGTPCFLFAPGRGERSGLPRRDTGWSVWLYDPDFDEQTMDSRRCRSTSFLGFRKHLRVSAHLRISASEWIPWTHRRPFSLRGGTGLDLHRSPDAAAAPDTRMQKDTQASVSSMNDANGLEEMQKSERSKMGEIKGLKAFQHDIYIY